MKNQKRFVISGMFKRYTILGACVMLAALFASAAQAETVMVDPGPASIFGSEVNYAQDFIIDNQTNTEQVDVLWTENKMLDWNSGDSGRQAIVLYGPNGCVAFSVQLLDTAGDPIQEPLIYGKVAPCDSAEAIIELFGPWEIGGIRLYTVEGFTADGEYEWTWDDSLSRPSVWQLSGNQPPIANPGGPYTGLRGEDVQFYGGNSYDPDGDDGDTLNYSWDFNDPSDPTPGTGATPTYIYSEANTYNVCLSVTDAGNATSTTCTTAEIGGDTEGPVANAGGPYDANSNGFVSFNSTGSSGFISDYLWDFGDGIGSSSQQNPGYNYDNTTGAEYHVTLTLKDTGDLTDVDTTTATVAGAQSNSPPTADAGEPVTGLVGQGVTFDGSGSDDLDGEIVQYDWLFGCDQNPCAVTDGGPNPTWVYDAPGTYVVTLRVYDDKNVRVDDTTTAEILADNLPPEADANGPYTGEVGVAVAFDSTGSSDPDGGEIELYVWFFGDDQYSLEEAPSHTYALPGAYQVDLYVFDDDGSVSMDTTTANIGFGDNEAPIADAKGPYAGLVGAPVSFNGADSYDPEDGEVKSFEWDFDDGDSSFASEPQHTFLEPGVYDVTLTVTDNDGAYDVDVTKAIIADGNILPVADVGGPYRGQIGVPVTFDGSASSDIDGNIETYAWDFGDSGSGEGETMDHVYDTAGLYRVALTVTDNDGATAADSIVVRIGTASVPPLADAGGPYNGARGTPVQFNGEKSDDAEGDIVSWEWDFGDDTSDTGPTPEHPYDETGTYIVTLTVTDGSGETDSDVAKVTVGEGGLPPVADAGGPYEDAAVGEVVSFNGTGSKDPNPNGSIESYAWDFGDPNDSTPGSGATPSHTYSAGGFYRVTLTVTNSAGTKNSDTTLAFVSSRAECDEVCRADMFECLDTARADGETCIDRCRGDRECIRGCNLNEFRDMLDCFEEYWECSAACQ